MTSREAWATIQDLADQTSPVGGHPDMAVWIALLDLKKKIENGQKERDRLVNQRLMNEIHDAHCEQDKCPKCGSELGFCPQGEYCTNPKCDYSM